MKIRSFDSNDAELIAKVHERHFGQEFELPNFDKGYHCAFIIEDNNEIILAGGIRPIAELVVVTNKDISAKKRVIALKESVRAGLFTCSINQYDQLHCFLQGNQWMRQVQTVGFRPTVGRSFVIDV